MKVSAGCQTGAGALAAAAAESRVYQLNAECHKAGAVVAEDRDYQLSGAGAAIAKDREYQLAGKEQPKVATKDRDYQLPGEGQSNVATEDRDYQLMGDGEFLAARHTYANVGDEEMGPVVSRVFLPPPAQDVSRLLGELQAAIGSGDRQRAANLAEELALLKAPCTLVEQQRRPRDKHQEEQKDETFR